MHFQVKCPQVQIVTVIRGRVFDVAIDLQFGSASFGRWYGVELSDEGPRQLYMAPTLRMVFASSAISPICITK
jgi:dTDP-4-dehydrorhamnose 3,5-epimerase